MTTEHPPESLPNHRYRETMEKISEKLTSASFRAATEFKRAADPMSRFLNHGEFEIWAQLGLELGAVSGRAWDCVAEYFKSSPTVLEIEVFAFTDLHQWVGHGKELAATSSEVAVSYFRHSPRFIDQLDLWSLEKWVKLAHRFVDGHWKSAKLAAAYFPSSLGCLPIFGLKGLDEWVEVAELISSKSHDIAQGFIENSPQWFAPLSDEEKRKVLNISRTMAENNYTSIPKFFPLLEQHQKRIKTDVRGLSYNICLNITRHSPQDALDYLESCPAILARVENKDQMPLMELGDRLSEQCWEAAREFVNRLPEILTELPIHKVEPWFKEGLEVCQGNPEAGMAYYAMESKRSQEVINGLQRTVHLADVNRVLNLYAEGLSARKLKINKIVEDNGSDDATLPATDGEYIYLPEKVVEFDDRAKNFKWFKIATAHQTGFFEYGTFDFNIRTFKELYLQHIPSGLREKVDICERNDLEGFFNLFRDTRLASTLFRWIENGRVDYLLQADYRGLKRDMLPILEHALTKRPSLEGLLPRQASLEMLLRITSFGEELQGLEPAMDTVYKFLTRETGRVLKVGATVFDSALAAARIYPLILSLSQLKSWRDDVIAALSRKLEDAEGDMDYILDLLLAEAEAEWGPEGFLEGDDYPLDLLEYQGDTKPEEVQKMMKLREIKKNINRLDEQGVPLSLELLKELLKMGAELDITEMSEEDLENSSGLFITNIDGLSEIPAYKKIKEMIDEDPEAIEHILYGGVEKDDPEANIYYYDEWDFLINDYRSRWCKLKEVSPGETDNRFVEDTLKENSELVAAIRKQFQMLRPEMFRKVKKLESGEEIDIDAAIEALVDKKCGISPSEKIYQRRDKRERDVSTVFLIDVSASTDEEIEKDVDLLPSDDPAWKGDKFSNPDIARGGGGPPPELEPDKKGKRIIDIEKEAMVLMAEALESIGDEYAIFCFSGYGRDNVECFVVKEFHERYQDKVKSRIGAIKPQRSTRMGPAIRHAVKKLDATDSRLRILILLSDGYPQDFDYGKDRTSKDYGIQDTARALHEAREKNIHPFLITVDPAGNDYLKDMCADDQYMVIEKVSALPQELLRTYRTLTYR